MWCITKHSVQSKLIYIYRQPHHAFYSFCSNHHGVLVDLCLDSSVQLHCKFVRLLRIKTTIKSSEIINWRCKPGKHTVRNSAKLYSLWLYNGELSTGNSTLSGFQFIWKSSSIVIVYWRIVTIIDQNWQVTVILKVSESIWCKEWSLIIVNLK